MKTYSMKKTYAFLLMLLLTCGKISATIITVPATYTSIQAAINASVNGDTILVSPGTYYENINFRGKNVVVTSQYYLAQNTSFISSTIIDGSAPVFQDTASCVIFNHNENSSAVLQGFTITGGKGTKWFDIHGAGTFREGGGILIELASPTIKHNYITNNIVTNTTGVVSTGGGGIRIGDGNPTICSNAITFNQARYGAGVVLNYTAGKITNNVIASNSGGQQYNGGSGIWAIEEHTLGALYIENNTIVNNSAPNSGGTGGLYIAGSSSVSVRNNIIYGNWPALQLKIVTATTTVNYNDIQGGYAGTGNINTDPLFAAGNYSLSAGSSCIDAGDPNAVYNDINDPANPGNALLPSLGSLTNDMGAYGGPCTAALSTFSTITLLKDETKPVFEPKVYPNPVTSVSNLLFYIENAQQVKITIINMLGQTVSEISNTYFPQGTHSVEIKKEALPEGNYFLIMKGTADLNYAAKLLVTDTR
jgi:hypothetical protein